MVLFTAQTFCIFHCFNTYCCPKIKLGFTGFYCIFLNHTVIFSNFELFSGKMISVGVNKVWNLWSFIASYRILSLLILSYLVSFHLLCNCQVLFVNIGNASLRPCPRFLSCWKMSWSQNEGRKKKLEGRKLGPFIVTQLPSTAQTQQRHCPCAAVCAAVLWHHGAAVDQWSRCAYSHPARHE